MIQLLIKQHKIIDTKQLTQLSNATLKFQLLENKY
jgi:hypothetical protein